MVQIILATGELAAADSPRPLELWTLIVAAFAALAAVVAAIITAVAAVRRDRSSWIRQEQTAACEMFSAAMHAAMDGISAGAVDRALHTPGFVGLEESFEGFSPLLGSVNESLRKLLVVGEEHSLAAAVDFMDGLAGLGALAYPRSGAAHEAALSQRAATIHTLARLALRADFAFRADLRVMSPGERRRFFAEFEKHEGAPSLAPRDPGTARATLIDWRVRTWDFEDSEARGGWLRADSPWSMLRVNNTNLYRPLGAVLIIRPNMPWRAAISSNLTPHQIAEIEADMSLLVRYGGRGGKTLYAGGNGGWVDGEIEAEQIWFWQLEGLPAA
ncbi:hypothetical protein [Microbacterium sp. VKM Ac-2923]|uniref:hypothetical protein n=1 Tax=Microbacterium sp. VKM Ac-2923 TaxID=2929476 RepID=UPI001FB3DF3A|nr:hypothetical protein [Microbacterium sp. VKM Ac-2923]MCJ1707709.1 hypothetical protein [Microbacterium sp. VKM Ac-2923]